VEHLSPALAPITGTPRTGAPAIADILVKVKAAAPPLRPPLWLTVNTLQSQTLQERTVSHGAAAQETRPMPTCCSRPDSQEKRENCAVALSTEFHPGNADG
jgi:hypothetical protein